MSFFTDFTPLTPLASSAALLMSADLSEGSSSIAVITFAVMTASSTYSPGDSFVEVFV
jgi:hypothetical protein